MRFSFAFVPEMRIIDYVTFINIYTLIYIFYSLGFDLKNFVVFMGYHI